MKQLPAPPKNCPQCDVMWSAINEHNNAHCYECGMDWSDMEEFHEVDDMSPEEAFHDMRRVDWEREVYRRADEEDRLTRQDYDDLIDNLADWNDEPPEE